MWQLRLILVNRDPSIQQSISMLVDFPIDFNITQTSYR